MRGSGWVGLAAALGALSVSAFGSTFVHMTPRELVAQADALVQGRVLDVHSFWSEGGRMIVTEATVEVEQTLLGETPAIVRVRTFGGRVGDFQVEAEGFPRFETGSRVMLFLETEPADDSLRVLGYQEGHFEVVDRIDGVRMIVPTVDEGARYLTRSGAPAPAARSLEIAEFNAYVRTTAERIGREYKGE